MVQNCSQQIAGMKVLINVEERAMNILVRSLGVCMFCAAGTALAQIGIPSDHRLPPDPRLPPGASSKGSFPELSPGAGAANAGRGLYSSYIYEQDGPPFDGIPDRIITGELTYDSRGNVVLEYDTTDDDANGTLDSNLKGAYRYNAKGLFIQAIIEKDDYAAPSPDSRETWYLEYDNKGKLVKRVIETDSDVDGTPDRAETFILNYDIKGRETEDLWEFDYDADGSANSSYRTAYSYNQANRLIGQVLYSDFDADGIDDSVATTTNTFDQKGNLVEAYTEEDDGYDGTVDETVLQTWAYNSRGDELTYSFKRVLNDGTVESIFTITNTYDAAGRLTYSLLKDDNNANGQIDGGDEAFRDAYVYDTQGNIVKHVQKFYSDGLDLNDEDKFLVRVDTQTFAY
jgi:hypothetical protein